MEAEIRWLDDPEVFRVNQMPAHSDHKFYISKYAFDCIEKGNQENELQQSLNGEWKFCFSRSAGERPAEFYQEDFDSSKFESIFVPMHIELAGFDKIHYINTMYPWEGHIFRRPAYSLEGFIPDQGSFSGAEYNPVGSYLTKFDLEQGLVGKRVYICFEGVEQAMYLWLNGTFIGYAEDSFTVSEFDLTPYIREKENLLAVEVHKRSTAAFLEDQDFFRFFGIFRNVTLYGIPRCHLEDIWVKPVLLEDCSTGEMAVDIRCSIEQNIQSIQNMRKIENIQKVQNIQNIQNVQNIQNIQKSYNNKKMQETKESGLSEMPTSVIPEWEEERFYAKIALMDADHNVCWEKRLDLAQHISLKMEEIGQVTGWEYGNPYLYTLQITVFDSKGHEVEYVPISVGFRRLEIRDGVIFCNGKRLIINGVNRHEWNMHTGRCISIQDMEFDMEVLLRNNINAVRTSHYPNQIAWYAMCDKNGIYVMAETNLESHGSWMKMGNIEPSWNVPGKVPQWREAVLDRARSNFEAFKNHPSILFWSLGNESYAGDHLAEMNRFFKERDSSRLVHYEGVANRRSYADRISDVESRMYETPEEIERYLTENPQKPFFLCEYMHNMGNSLGGMRSYMDLLNRYERYQGGFIWDFIDQAILVEDEVTGQKVLRYGGDFDDRPSDYEFSGNGILFADRTEKPALQEVKYYYGLYRQK